MDSNIIITWSITILTIFSLIVYIYKGKRNKEKRNISLLQSFASENECTISSFDYWDKSFIGIDENESKKLFFIRNTINENLKEVINLKEVLSCKMDKASRSVKYNKEMVNVIDKIELNFNFINTKKPKISLEFYNSDYDHLTLSGELQIAEKWLAIVNKMIVDIKNNIYNTFENNPLDTGMVSELANNTNNASFPIKSNAKSVVQKPQYCTI